MNSTLLVGRIPYLNLLPIYRELDRMDLPVRYIEDYPAMLNRMLTEGELDVSPSSSVQYLRARNTHGYIPGHSISARGSIRSIMLFSRVPVESLHNCEIMVTHQSETSIALLKVILGKFLGLDFTMRVSSAPSLEAIKEHSAYLSIGDDALVNSHGARMVESEEAKTPYSVCLIGSQAFYVYDLCTLWNRHTGRPMVFALWTYTKEAMSRKAEAIAGFRAALDRARDAAVLNLEGLASETFAPIGADALLEYWRLIEYGLPEDCVSGLDLFGSYVREVL